MKLSKEELQIKCEQLEKADIFDSETFYPDSKSEARKAIVATEFNKPFIEAFKRGSPDLKNTFIHMGYEWRVLYVGHTQQLFVERIGVEGMPGEPFSEALATLLDDVEEEGFSELVRLFKWLYIYWNPDGFYALEKYVMESV